MIQKVSGDKSCDVHLHKLREDALPRLWKDFLQDISCANFIQSHLQVPLFMELVNETVVEKMIRNMYTVSPPLQPKESDTYLSKDEENI